VLQGLIFHRECMSKAMGHRKKAGTEPAFFDASSGC
jgi:hypothetical protein